MSIPRAPLRVVGAVLAAVLALASLGACQVPGSVVTTHAENHTFDVGAAPLVMVETFNGRISVVAGPDGTIDARVVSRGAGTSQADAERDLQNVQVSFDQQPGDRVTITARRTDHPLVLGDSGADMEVTLPAASSVELRTSNGRIEATNVTGSVLARTSNGAITTRGGEDLDLDTSNGPVTVNGAGGRLTIHTSNGSVDALAVKDVVASVETSNADLSFSGSLSPGTHQLRTSNGSLNLSLPGNASFSIDGETSNASVKTDFPLTISGTSLTGSVGETPGATIIDASTSNGDLSVTKQQP